MTATAGTGDLEPGRAAQGFGALGLAEDLTGALGALGYEEPTPIQREAIPILLSGRDLLGQAATGTGKTAAFALPMLERIARAPDAGGRPRALVLVPTRELAMQVAQAVHTYGRPRQVRVASVYGGSPMGQQIRALERGVDVVVATPGRALDHIRRGTLTLDALAVLTLDEADEMLDIGFAEDLDAILEAVPAERQTALFSATMSPRIARIAERHLTDPARVMIGGGKGAPKLPRVRQVAYIVARAQKPAALTRVLDMEAPGAAIVFCRTRLEVDEVAGALAAQGYRADALHGGMSQADRDRVMRGFRGRAADLLVATDVAARGLDVEHITHVVNYDPPSAPEAYVHRIGRTGRAGRAGVAITLLEPREHRLLRNIEAYTKQSIEVAAVPTVADLRARRLELARASLRETLLAGDLDGVRVVVENLAGEFDIMDVAAAALKMALAEMGGERQEVDIPGPALARRPERAEATPRPANGARRPGTAAAPRRSRGAVARVHVGAGRRAGLRPADLVGAITNEAGVEPGVIGAIEIGDRDSVVEVAAPVARRVVSALRAATIRGKSVTVKLETPRSRPR
jgi:ATP-dependent RNA helicase DeaD